MQRFNILIRLLRVSLSHSHAIKLAEQEESLFYTFYFPFFFSFSLTLYIITTAHTPRRNKHSAVLTIF